MENLFLDRNQAHTKLQEFPPSHIAVAYVGQDWNRLIDSSQLQEIILSPTLGTNPRAVDALVEQLGWDKVHFLDELHAKIYWSTDAVIWGSFNLSNNALGCNLEGGLIEAGIFSKENGILDKAKELYDICKYKAIRQYKSTQQKKEKLKHLHQLYNKSIENRIIDAKSLIAIENKIPVYSGQYLITWCNPEVKVEINKDAHLENVSIKDSGFDLSKASSLCFTEQDKSNLRQGEWILVWAVTQQNRPRKIFQKDSFYWLYIHDLVVDGYVPQEDIKDYRLVAFEWSEKKKPTVPFELDAEIYEAFRATLDQTEFSSFHPTEGIWTLNEENKNIEEFVETWRKNLKILQNQKK